MFRRVRVLVTVGVAGSILGACSSGSESAPTVPVEEEFVVPEADAVPAEQQAAFADSAISLQEYEAAFQQFVECADGAVTEVARDEVTGSITYQSSGELLVPGEKGGSAANDCYQRYFVQTEVAFQLTDAAVQDAEPSEQMKIFNDGFRPCLDLIGVEVPADLEFGDENWIPLLDEVVIAKNDGRCSQELLNPPSTGE
jgi:hypothetical protein